VEVNFWLGTVSSDDLRLLNASGAGWRICHWAVIVLHYSCRYEREEKPGLAIPGRPGKLANIWRRSWSKDYLKKIIPKNPDCHGFAQFVSDDRSARRGLQQGFMVSLDTNF
jgi:hypothetical protein